MAIALEEREEARPVAQHALKLGETTEERLDIELNGRKLRAWIVKNNRCPVSVLAELEDARQAWYASRSRIWENDEPPPDMVEVVRELLLQAKAAPESTSISEFKARLDELEQSLTAYEAEPIWLASSVDWEAYVTRCLMAVVPGLEEREADLLRREQRLIILQELGHFRRPEETTIEEAPKASDAAPSTGAAPEPSSAVSTV